MHTTPKVSYVLVEQGRRESREGGLKCTHHRETIFFGGLRFIGDPPTPRKPPCAIAGDTALDIRATKISATDEQSHSA
jgi:hypothetical protein